MKIVIEIDDDRYEKIINNEVYAPLDICVALYNGKPLPEHHGRLIDESQIKHIECHTEQEPYGTKIRYVKTTDAPTIIEADRGE